MKYCGLLLCFFLVGCGFHFRNSADIPPTLKTVYIQNSNTRSALTPQLAQNLQALGVHLVSSAHQAPIILNIISDSFVQSYTALGTAQQLNGATLNYIVTLNFINAKKQPLTQPVTFTASVNYWQNANQILGDSMATPALKQNLVHDMTQKILGYLSADDTRKALAHG